MREQEKRKVVFRADGNKIIGWGHVMRLLSLAAVLKNDFDCVFAVQQPDAFLEKEILKQCRQVIPLPATDYVHPDKADRQHELPFDLGDVLTGSEIVVIDGYFFGEAYQVAVKASGCRLVFIDDLVKMHMYADVVINQTPGISAMDYSRETYTQVFTGQEYVLLRSSFIEAAGKKLRIPGKLKNVLISFGGADYYDLNIKFAGFAVELPSFAENLHIILPADYKKINEIQGLMLNTSGTKLHTYSRLSSDEVAALMTDADAGIFPASVMAYEALAVGLPLMCGWYVENQELFYDFLSGKRLVAGLGNLLEMDQEKFNYLAEIDAINYPAFEDFRKDIFKSSNNLERIFLQLG